MSMKYKYTLKVENVESGFPVIEHEFDGSKEIGSFLEYDVNFSIKGWEDLHTLICKVCGERKLLAEITFKETDDDRLDPICHPCAEQVIDGSKKLPEVEAEELYKTTPSLTTTLPPQDV